jgi:twitching motility two-component system response regulator PilG
MKVLIAEDTETLRSILQVYLMGMNLEFVQARDGMEALSKAREVQPDLVITDVKMPRMDGFELCASLRADRALHRTPVVMLTSLSDAASREKGRLVGATAFLTKPVSVDDLRRCVSGLLGTKVGHG